MNKIWPSFLLVLLLPLIAVADAPRVDRIDITEFGIYVADTTSKTNASQTPTGTVSNLANVRHAETTQTVSAQLGVRFGYRYNVVGSPNGAEATLRFKTLFPAPGIRNPTTGQQMNQAEYDRAKTIGSSSYRDYGFDHDWEMVPGVWTLQIWYQDHMLAEQKFTVVKK